MVTPRAPRPFRGTGWLHERPTLDVVVLLLVAVVAFVIAGAVTTVAILEIMNPNIDTDEITRMVDAQTGTILGALLGLVAGQATGRREAQPFTTTQDMS